MNLKKLQKNKKDLSNSVNLIPMINLIFLLLIFFLLTGVISKKDSIEIIRPSSSFGEQEKNSKEFNVIKINNKNHFFFDEQKIDVEDINSIPKLRDKKLIIEIDKSSNVYNFNKLIKELKKYDIKKIFIKVKEKEVNNV